MLVPGCWIFSLTETTEFTEFLGFSLCPLRTLREIFYKLKLVGLPASGWTERQSLFNDVVAFSKIVKSPDDFIVRSLYHVCKN